jgi:hypothetical protein
VGRGGAKGTAAGERAFYTIKDAGDYQVEDADADDPEGVAGADCDAGDQEGGVRRFEMAGREKETGLSGLSGGAGADGFKALFEFEDGAFEEVVGGGSHG